ncbi:hypothetical protein KY348_03420 [Candidatus Woesearchaeota archaeon]|nr:hypothetical protein [Candidatus Woesearchaeota archaeon]
MGIKIFKRKSKEDQKKRVIKTLPNVNIETIISKLSTSIKDRDPEALACAVRDFVVSFYPDHANPKRVEAVRSWFNREVVTRPYFNKLPKNILPTAKETHFRDVGITGILEAFDNKTPVYTYGFFTGTSGQRVYFSGENSTVWYRGGLNNGALERFSSLYGIKPVKLDV